MKKESLKQIKLKQEIMKIINMKTISIKKTGICLVMALISALILCGCTAGGADAKEGKLRIVTTIFPEYDWVREIMGDKTEKAELTLLMGNGVDLHSYQPTVDDIIRISGCDLFIYVGGESDEWVDEALQEAANKNMVVLNLMDLLGDKVKEEEQVEGMQAEAEHDHDEETEYDEHVWLSLKNAAVICDKIAEALSSLDPENSEYYRSNLDLYKQRINALDTQFNDTVKNGRVKTILFGDRFPFRYFTDDYGLSYYAAFAGCSAETEASFETVIFLANKTDELKLPAILTIDGSDGRIAETIRDNTVSRDQKILTLNSMQSVTSRDISGGTDYVSIMEENLKVLKEALD